VEGIYGIVLLLPASADYRMQRGNPSGISQSEELATCHNLNLTSAPSGYNLINDSPMLVNPTSENRQQKNSSHSSSSIEIDSDSPVTTIDPLYTSTFVPSMVAVLKSFND